MRSYEDDLATVALAGALADRPGGLGNYRLRGLDNRCVVRKKPETGKSEVIYRCKACLQKHSLTPHLFWLDTCGECGHKGTLVSIGYRKPVTLDES